MYNNQPQQYDNTNKVSLWQGDKSKNPKAPDLKGVVNVNGVDYQISLWNNAKHNGPKSPVLNGSIQLKQANPQHAQQPAQHQAPVQNAYAPVQPQQAAPVAHNNLEDEIPF